MAFNPGCTIYGVTWQLQKYRGLGPLSEVQALWLGGDSPGDSDGQPGRTPALSLHLLAPSHHIWPAQASSTLRSWTPLSLVIRGEVPTDWNFPHHPMRSTLSMPIL